MLVHSWLHAVVQIKQTSVVFQGAEEERRPLYVDGLAGAGDGGVGVDLERVVAALEDGAGDVWTVVYREL